MNIQPGDLLGVIAPASPCDPEIFKVGIAWLENSGFRLRVALDPVAAWATPRHLFSSDTPQARVDALYELFEDSEVKAIICVRGGYGAMEMLPLLDLARLSRYAKPFVGISDVTVLLNLFAQRTAIPAIHGASFGAGFSKADHNESAEKSCRDLFDLLSGLSETVWGDNIRYLVGEADFQGPIVGGNLSMLCAITGTSFAPEYDNQVLFLEEVGEKPYRIHRLLLQLKLAGHLKNLKGVVIGELLNCATPESSAMTLDDVVRDIFADAPYPVVAGAPFGHGPLNLSFRIGSTVSVSAGQIKFG